MLAVLLALGALSPALLPEQQAAAQEGGATDQLVQEPVTTSANPVLDTFVASTPDMNVLLNEMTLVWVHDEEYARIIASCAGVGLRNVAPHPDGPMVLIPNVGDLDVSGSTVAIKLHPDGQVEFIPRTQNQLIRVPVNVGDKVADQEVLSLTFDEGMQLMKDGHLIWTARDQGPFGNGHGLPGHIGACDPRYPGDKFYQDLDNANDDNTNDDPDND
jgi:hypothetical protein